MDPLPLIATRTSLILLSAMTVSIALSIASVSVLAFIIFLTVLIFSGSRMNSFLIFRACDIFNYLRVYFIFEPYTLSILYCAGFLAVAPLEEIIRNVYKLNLFFFHVFFVKKAGRGINNPLLVGLLGTNPFGNLKIKRHSGQCFIVLFVNQINRLISEIAHKELLLAYLFLILQVFTCAEIIHIPCKCLVIRQFAFQQCLRIQWLSDPQILKPAVIAVFLNRPFNPLAGDVLADIFVWLIFRSLSHLDKDKLAIAAVFLVHVHNCMACCAGAGKGVKNKGVFSSSKLHNMTKQFYRFWIIKHFF